MRELTRKITHIRRLWHILILLILLVSLAGIPQRSTRAATVRYVTPHGDALDTCASWVHACTLQAALDKGGTDVEIWVLEGTYYPTIDTSDRAATFQLVNGIRVYGGFDGTETLRGQRDPERNATILSGAIGVHHSYHVVTGDGTNSTARLDGFTIANGDASEGEFHSNNTGGGMKIESGSPTLAYLKFRDNVALYHGGGMYNNNSSPSMSHITFTDNTAGWGGGGLYNVGSSPTMNQVTFITNHAGTVGGGMFNDSDSNPSLTSMTFDSNTAVQNGGGLYNILSNPVISQSSFLNNTAGGIGGGISNNQCSPAYNNVTFSGNSSSGEGGGMNNNLNSSPTLNQVTFFGNTSDIAGGAIFNSNNSNPTIRGSIIWGNDAPVEPSIGSDDESVPMVTYSDVKGGFEGAGNIDADPLLGPLGLYGGSTKVLPLLPGSPAIDTGLQAVGVCGGIDQRGVSRPQLDHCDMGAYESRGFNLAAVSGGGQSTYINTAFPDPIVVRVSAIASTEPVEGGQVYFILPNQGASALPDEYSATITGGLASMAFTANAHVGSYYIVFYTFGSDDLVGAHYMTNLLPPGGTIIFLPFTAK